MLKIDFPRMDCKRTFNLDPATRFDAFQRDFPERRQCHINDIRKTMIRMVPRNQFADRSDYAEVSCCNSGTSSDEDCMGFRGLRTRDTCVESLSIRKHGILTIPATFSSRRLSDASCDSGLNTFSSGFYDECRNGSSRR